MKDHLEEADKSMLRLRGIMREPIREYIENELADKRSSEAIVTAIMLVTSDIIAAVLVGDKGDPPPSDVGVGDGLGRVFGDMIDNSFNMVSEAAKSGAVRGN